MQAFACSNAISIGNNSRKDISNDRETMAIKIWFENFLKTTNQITPNQKHLKAIRVSMTVVDGFGWPVAGSKQAISI